MEQLEHDGDSKACACTPPLLHAMLENHARARLKRNSLRALISECLTILTVLNAWRASNAIAQLKTPKDNILGRRGLYGETIPKWFWYPKHDMGNLLGLRRAASYKESPKQVAKLKPPKLDMDNFRCKCSKKKSART
eukprot:2113833-Amphidinium_carterae.1